MATSIILRRLNNTMTILVLTFFSVGGLFCYVHHRFGSVENAKLYLIGYSLITSGHTLDLGKIWPGQSRIIEYSITNLTKDTIKTYGYDSPCSCTEFIMFPKEFPSFSTTTLQVRFFPQASQVSKSYTGQVKVFTGNRFNNTIFLKFTAEIISGFDGED